ncbi:MAG: cupin domain-containing protein [Caryophanon sp.]|nr:cupin domain-containing protein [Caryophanon sp.]
MLAQTITHKYTGEQITFVETAEQTNGKHLLIEVTLPPFGDGPPLHVHDSFVEHFTVLEGTLTVIVDETTHTLQAGDNITAPMYTPHTFTNDSDAPVRFSVLLKPPLQFEQSARIHYGLMHDGLTDDKGTPKNLFHLLYILQLQNTLVAGKSLRAQRLLLRVGTRIGKLLGMYNPLNKYLR